MHFSGFLLAIAATVTSVSACTFAIDNRNSLAAAGGGGLTCQTFIYAKDDADPFVDQPDAKGEITCDVSGGCADLDYNGQTYTFCHDGMTELVNIASKATVQRQPDGATDDIYPDGLDRADGHGTPVDQYERHAYWRGNIHCP